MMKAVMHGVRVLEVAEATFAPATSALLADWGADVIKVEHAERGDALRALSVSGIADVPADVHVLLEHSNRGKRSLGLDLSSADGRDILYRLAAGCDVFVTNKLPEVREKLGIDAAALRAHSPRIIYASATGLGERGPDANRGSYDSLAFWARAGMGVALGRTEEGGVSNPPAGYGDSVSAMTLAGGIMGALFHRERTGEAVTVDVSLLGTGLWALGQPFALSMLLNVPWTPPPGGRSRTNPLANNYQTRDGRWLAFTCLQPMKYWAPFCAVIGRPDLAGDPRFASYETLAANCPAAIEILRAEFAGRDLARWREVLASFSGQWAVVQDTLEAAADPQVLANGYVQECRTADGTPFRLAAAPVQFGGEPATPRRAPQFSEHGDEILAELGLDWDAIVDLKVQGVVS